MKVFGDIRVVPDRLEVWRGDQLLDLEPKALRVLLYLLENRQRVVPKQELFDRVWSGVEVTDNALTRVIAQLRRSLGDDAKQARYIETIPTIGYRFIGEPDKTKSRAPLIGAGLLLIFAFGAAAWHLTKRNPPIEAALKPLPFKQLTNSRTLDASPAYSPDGRFLAYSSDRSGQFEIYLRPADGVGREIQVTDNGDGNLEAAFSPDGKLIAFHSLARGGISIVPATGGPITRLTSSGSQPAWSPDGRRIAFRTTNLISLAPLDSVTIFPSQIGVVDVETGAERRFGSEETRTNPSWTPDGKWLLFAASDFGATSRIRALEVSTGRVHDLHQGRAGLFSPASSPDQRWIYYTRLEKAAGSTVLQLPVDPLTLRATGAAQAIATPAGYAQQLRLSADGKRLAMSLITMDSNLWTLAVNQRTPPQPVTQNSNFRNTSPGFSPDAEWLAYQARRVGAPTEIWLIRPDGSGAERVDADAAGSWLTNWHPAGGKLHYLRTGSRALVEFDLATRQKKTLPLSIPPLSSPRTLMEGDMLMHALRDGRLRIGRWNPATGVWKAIETGPEPVGFPSISPDGKWITAERMSDAATHLVVFPVEGGRPAQLTSGSELSWPHSWAPDNRRIAIARQYQGAWNIAWVDRETRQIETLTNYRSARSFVRYPAWSPKGDQIVYEFNEVKGNVYELELR